MLKWLGDTIKWLGTNEYILGFISLLSIVGFIITIVVERRTATLNKVLKHNELVTAYNKDRLAYSKLFLGHHNSIVQDNDHSDALIDDILKGLTEFKVKYAKLLTIKMKWAVWELERQLMKKSDKVNFHSVAKRLTILSGFLGKKEETING